MFTIDFTVPKKVFKFLFQETEMEEAQNFDDSNAIYNGHNSIQLQ